MNRRSLAKAMNETISLGVSALVVIVIIILVGIGIYLNYPFNTNHTMTSDVGITHTSFPTTTTATSNIGNYPTSSETTNSTLGLGLSLSVNKTLIQSGQAINVSMSLFNAFPYLNSLQTSNEFSFQGVPVAVWPPCFFSVPMQVVVLQGNYTALQLPTVANYSMAYTCAEGWSIDHVILQPNSDNATITGTYSVAGANQTLGPFNLALNFTTSGYWDLQNLSKQLNTPILGQQSPPTPPSSIAFVPGVYTVAVEDEWGQIALLHFVVTQLT